MRPLVLLSCSHNGRPRNAIACSLPVRKIVAPLLSEWSHSHGRRHQALLHSYIKSETDKLMNAKSTDF